MALNLTARRNVERIDRFLNRLQSARRQPNRRELFWLREALMKLQEGQYPAGEDAMDKAERTLPVPEHARRADDQVSTVRGRFRVSRRRRAG